MLSDLGLGCQVDFGALGFKKGFEPIRCWLCLNLNRLRLQIKHFWFAPKFLAFYRK